MKRIFLLITAVFFTLSSAYGEAVSSKAYSKRVELIGYLRTLEPIVKNYPGDEKKDEAGKASDNANDSAKKPSKAKGERAKKYQEIKTIFQEGLLYYFEGGYLNAYRRFLEAQLETEKIYEDLSQAYVERTEAMLKAAVDKKDENDKLDKSLMDITIEYGRESKIRRDFDTDRVSPKIERSYDPKEYHYYLNKNTIEENITAGYKYLGEAKNARLKALKIERSLESHQKLQPNQRRYRIEQYIAAINRCRDARKAAVNIFRQKYPYDNYYLYKDGEVKLEKTTMNYSDNPYVNRKNLHPIFDKSIPESFRKDATDITGRIFQDEVDRKIKMKNSKTMKKDLKVKSEDGDDTPSASSPQDTPKNTDAPTTN
jgi:hypothetical protein